MKCQVEKIQLTITLKNYLQHLRTPHDFVNAPNI